MKISEKKLHEMHKTADRCINNRIRWNERLAFMGLPDALAGDAAMKDEPKKEIDISPGSLNDLI